MENKWISLPEIAFGSNVADDFNKGYETGKDIYDRDTLFEIGKRGEAGDYDGMRKVAFARGNPDAAFKVQNFQDQREAKERDYEKEFSTTAAGVFSNFIDKETDPVKRKALWDRMRSSHRLYGTQLTKFGIDPEDPDAASRFFIAKARGYVDPAKEAENAAELRLKNARAGYYERMGDGDGTDGAAGGKIVQSGGRIYRVGPEGSAVDITPGGGGSNGTSNIEANIAAGLDRLSAAPEEYGSESFTNAIGPWQGDNESWPLPQIARGYGSVLNAAKGGNGNVGEVRNRIAGDANALAMAIKPLVRKPGEGTWTDADQALLSSIVGDLATARDEEEYNRRIEGVRERIKANFGIDIRGGQSARAPAPSTPQPGTVIDGYLFKGGDPSKSDNWQIDQ